MLNDLFKLYALLERSPITKKILLLIAESEIPLSSSIISQKVNIKQTNIIRILNKLEETGLIEEVTGKKRSRMYIITDKGQRILKMGKNLT